jgi:hypothetical protein
MIIVIAWMLFSAAGLLVICGVSLLRYTSAYTITIGTQTTVEFTDPTGDKWRVTPEFDQKRLHTERIK